MENLLFHLFWKEKARILFIFKQILSHYQIARVSRVHRRHRTNQGSGASRVCVCVYWGGGILAICIENRKARTGAAAGAYSSHGRLLFRSLFCCFLGAERGGGAFQDSARLNSSLVSSQDSRFSCGALDDGGTLLARRPAVRPTSRRPLCPAPSFTGRVLGVVDGSAGPRPSLSPSRSLRCGALARLTCSLREAGVRCQTMWSMDSTSWLRLLLFLGKSAALVRPGRSPTPHRLVRRGSA